jgi:hypothetical protein
MRETFRQTAQSDPERDLCTATSSNPHTAKRCNTASGGIASSRSGGNLARKAIIPAVHEILEPPSFSIAGLRRLKVKHLDGDDIDEFIQRLKKMPPVQVAGYDILCAERLPDDPPSGSVKLLLHAGDSMRSTLTHLKNVLDEWERDVERD